MNCLAQILKSSGYIISGSDHKSSAITQNLQSLGIKVTVGHSRDNIAEDIDLVVYTAAVRQDNCELAAAREKGIGIMDRAELLGLIMKNYNYPICVSGTHGKTTTTSMAAEIFLSAQKDPTILVGGYLNSIEGTLRNGGMDYIIVESCEYFDSFLKFFPFVGIILNLEADHLDYFKDLGAVRKSFAKFAQLIPDNGALVINNGIEKINEITEGLRCKVITFGPQEGDWTAQNIVYNETGCAQFDACLLGESKCKINLGVQGEHNILNALSVIASSYALGIDFESIQKGLNNFIGAKRRFQYKGEFNGVTVIDDYAHHPTEVRATIRSANNIPANNIWCVFQPHTHSRTKSLLNDFAECFDEADKIVILDIYSPAGREEESTLIHSLDLVNLIKKRGKEAYYISSFSDARQFLLQNCLHNDMLITMGAGDVYLLGENMLKN